MSPWLRHSTSPRSEMKISGSVAEVLPAEKDLADSFDFSDESDEEQEEEQGKDEAIQQVQEWDVAILEKQLLEDERREDQAVLTPTLSCAEYNTKLIKQGWQLKKMKIKKQTELRKQWQSKFPSNWLKQRQKSG